MTPAPQLPNSSDIITTTTIPTPEMVEFTVDADGEMDWCRVGRWDGHCQRKENRPISLKVASDAMQLALDDAMSGLHNLLPYFRALDWASWIGRDPGDLSDKGTDVEPWQGHLGRWVSDNDCFRAEGMRCCIVLIADLRDYYTWRGRGFNRFRDSKALQMIRSWGIYDPGRQP